jgi:uncharacterized protein with von Willebrand factor type A (vWA) domain
MTPIADAPYDSLAALPRAVWLHAVITSAGEPAARLADMARWFSALAAGELPPADADFGDPDASLPLRAVAGELALPGLAKGTPALAEQIMRTLLWHLDRIVDHQPHLSRAEAIAEVTQEFRAAWQIETTGLEDSLALLQGLGDFSDLSWDVLRGHLRSRPWQEARAAADRLAQLPALAALIRMLGRTERSTHAPPAQQATPNDQVQPPTPLRAVQTRLPNEPGEITGIRWSARIERMLGSEAVMLRHPVLKKLWRARHAESRLLSWETEAVLTDWRGDPLAAPHTRLAPDQPQSLERGPIILCLDTSGSMQGAPERIAKAIAIAALRAAHEAQRGCKLIAFGGPDELIERDLVREHGSGRGVDTGSKTSSATISLQALLDLMSQSFDGGTDVQTPIERAIDRVHEARWRSADVLIVSDGEFGCMPATLARLDEARTQLGLRVQGILVGDRETLGLLEVCDHIHWEREWRRFADAPIGADARSFSPVHSKSLTALYFPNALSARAARAAGIAGSSGPP